MLNTTNKSNSNIIIILVITIILLIAMIFGNYTRANNLNLFSSIVGETYETPIIKTVSTSNKTIKVKSGIYAYGDVNQDGIIDFNDLNSIKDMYDKDNVFNDNEILLADLNKDKKINNKDYEILDSFVKKNITKKYEVKNDGFEYCLNTSKDSSKCLWQTDKKLSVSKEGRYYIFVKKANKNVISSYYEYNHVFIDYDNMGV